MDERLPQFLHRPVQILWFDAQEFILVMTTIFIAVIVGGLVGWAFIGVLLLFIPWKRSKPRGFVMHLAWRWGLVSLPSLSGSDPDPFLRVTMMGWFNRTSTHSPDMIGDMRPSFRIHRYLQGSANLFEENRLLKFAVAGLTAMTGVLGIVIHTSALNQRTVIIPFATAGDLYVTGNTPSPDYLAAITRNIVALSGTYSAYSADAQFRELLRLVHPSAYNGLRDSLDAIVTELDANPTLSIATYIRPEPVTVTDSMILVPVEKVRVIGGVIRKFRGNLRIRYAVENGRFWLTALSEEKFDDVR